MRVTASSSCRIASDRPRSNRRRGPYRAFQLRAHFVRRLQDSMTRPTGCSPITGRHNRSGRPQDWLTRGTRLSFPTRVQRNKWGECPFPSRRRCRRSPTSVRRRKRPPKRRVTRRYARKRSGRVNGNRANGRRNCDLQNFPFVNRPLNCGEASSRGYSIERSQRGPRGRRYPVFQDGHHARVAGRVGNDGSWRCLFRQAHADRGRHRKYSRAGSCNVHQGGVSNFQCTSARVADRVKRCSRRRGLDGAWPRYAKNGYRWAFFRTGGLFCLLPVFCNAGLRRGICVVRVFRVLFGGVTKASRILPTGMEPTLPSYYRTIPGGRNRNSFRIYRPTRTGWRGRSNRERLASNGEAG